MPKSIVFGDGARDGPHGTPRPSDRAVGGGAIIDRRPHRTKHRPLDPSPQSLTPSSFDKWGRRRTTQKPGVSKEKLKKKNNPLSGRSCADRFGANPC